MGIYFGCAKLNTEGVGSDNERYSEGRFVMM